MELKKAAAPLLIPLLALLPACVVGCSPQPDHLACYTDYNHTISCVWNSTNVPLLAGAACRLDAKKIPHSPRKYRNPIQSSCVLEPTDVSTPELKNCSLIFEQSYFFLSLDNYSISLNCTPVRFFYSPGCHIKLNPPAKPEINATTISCFNEVAHPSVRANTIEKQCEGSPCKEDLDDEDRLIRGQRYQARVRVSVSEDNLESVWSDWSPTASWVSSVGRVRPPESGAGSRAWGMMVAGAMFLALFLVVILFRTDKLSWVGIAKKLKGPPLPSPEKSFLRDSNFETWLRPHFGGASFFKPVEIVSVQVTCDLDGAACHGPVAELLEKMRGESVPGSNSSSSFSNPSYSELCSAPPVASLAAGNLEPCAADTPYGPVGAQAKTAGQDGEEEARKAAEILQMLSKGSGDSKSMQVISDYEKVEGERATLQNIESGGREVSRDSLEPASEEEGRTRHGAGDAGFLQFLGKISSGGVFGSGSVQVCSDYERVQNLRADVAELPSLDSGVSSGGEEQPSQEESLEDEDRSTESTSFLLPPFTFLPLAPDVCRAAAIGLLRSGFKSAGPHTGEANASERATEPSGDGYMPVRPEQR